MSIGGGIVVRPAEIRRVLRVFRAIQNLPAASSGGYYLSSDKFYGLKVLDGSLCFCCVDAERERNVTRGQKHLSIAFIHKF